MFNNNNSNNNDKITNVWWKRAGALHKGVVESFKDVFKSNEEYPDWLS